MLKTSKQASFLRHNWYVPFNGVARPFETLPSPDHGPADQGLSIQSYCLSKFFTKARIWFTRSKIWNNFLKRRLLISSTLIRIYYRNNVLRSHKSMCWKFSPSKLSGTETKRRNNIRVAWCWMNSHFRWAWGLLAEQTVFHLGIDEIFHSLRKHSAWSHINFPLARTSAFRGRDWIP